MKSPFWQLLLTPAVMLTLLSLAGCGVGSYSSFTGSTPVTLLLSSTANDQYASLWVTFTSISLVSSSGKTVTLLNTTRSPEFIHLNSQTESLATVAIPQGVYVSASATIQDAGVTCIGLGSSGGITYNGVSSRRPVAQINVPSPITVTGQAMGLSLNLLASQSVDYPNPCYLPVQQGYSIAPSFTLTGTSFSQPVVEDGLKGEIDSVSEGPDTFSVSLTDGQSLSVATTSATVYQGINSFAGLTQGTVVDMDATIQPNGSLVATRIAVPDTDTTNLSFMSGPLVFSSEAYQDLIAFGQQMEGPLALAPPASPFSYGNAKFQISQVLPNLPNLPFTPDFSSSNFFAGQNVSITTHTLTVQPAPVYATATTVTLLPQTLDGIILGTGNEGGFRTYTISLASYDSIPAFAVQDGQTTALANPGTVVVYADSNTQMLNVETIATGGTFRFTGLLFNDGGTLRMDCGKVNDGVPQ